MTFEHSNHAKTIAGINASAGGLGKLGLPVHQWPVLSFPELQHPIHKYEAENAAEEERCLNNVREEFASGDVAAVLVEPITFFGGKMATPRYFQKLRSLAKEFNVSLIVDETKTGLGMTGKTWGFEHWYLEDAPDMVVFGGATQIAGVFSNNDYRPLTPGKLSTHGNVDLAKLKRLGRIIQTIQKKDLMWRVGDTSAFIKVELERMREKNPYFSSVRGYGHHLSFDLTSTKAGDFLKHMFKIGAYVNMVGPTTVGIRPSLTLEPKHLSHFRDNIANLPRAS